MRYLILLIPVLAACTARSPAGRAEPERPALADTLDLVVPALLDSLRVPGAAIALIRNGEVAWSRGYGYADVESGRAVTTGTVFQVASISKPVAAWGVMKLVEEGDIALHGSLNDYLSRWRIPAPDSAAFDLNDVNLRRVLSHTAGLSLSGYPGFDPDSGALPTVEQSLAGNTNGVGGVRLAMRPGTRWQYSGGGFTLLQLLVEERGLPFADYMKQHVLLPLGMTSSAYTWEPELRSRTATAYDRAGGRRLPNYLFAAQAAAGLYTTVDDLARWVASGLTGPVGQPPGRGVLTASTIAAMHQAAPASASQIGHYGLGHIVDTLSNGDAVVGHTGGNRGWRSIFLALPATGDGIVVLTNSNTGAALYTRVTCDWLRVTAAATRRGCPQPPTPLSPAALEQTLRAHIDVLAADSLQGRGAGYRGDSLAAGYIANRMEAIGLVPVDIAGGAPSFMQSFELHPRGSLQPFATLQTQNVVALLRGTDPRLRNEVVVVGAHYDGQGMRGEANMGRRANDQSRDSIWNSANDNASGSAALLTAAEALARGEPLRRSIVFVAFGAEEHGLVGSLHYAAHPPIPWEAHVAMINVEMIAWERDRPMNVRATATSHGWDALLDSATALTGVPVTRIQPVLTNDTDHYGFGVRGLPAIHYGVGGDRTRYHAVSDDADAIEYTALAQRTRHIIELTRLVANGDARLPFTWEHPRDHGITGTPLTREERAKLGLGADHGGIKVNAVAFGLPAHAAGLRAGDAITEIDGVALDAAVPGLRKLRDAMLGVEPGGDIVLTVVRDGEQHDLRVRFPA